jgi:hypothetical protein
MEHQPRPVGRVLEEEAVGGVGVDLECGVWDRPSSLHARVFQYVSRSRPDEHRDLDPGSLMALGVAAPEPRAGVGVLVGVGKGAHSLLGELAIGVDGLVVSDRGGAALRGIGEHAAVVDSAPVGGRARDGGNLGVAVSQRRRSEDQPPNEPRVANGERLGDAAA